jgi:hypothetical protein
MKHSPFFGCRSCGAVSFFALFFAAVEPPIKPFCQHAGTDAELARQLDRSTPEPTPARRS